MRRHVWELQPEEFVKMPQVRFISALSKTVTQPEYRGLIGMQDTGVLALYWGRIYAQMTEIEDEQERALQALAVLLPAWLLDLQLPADLEGPILDGVRDWWGRLTDADLRERQDFVNTPGLVETLRPLAQEMEAAAFRRKAKPAASRKPMGKQRFKN